MRFTWCRRLSRPPTRPFGIPSSLRPRELRPFVLIADSASIAADVTRLCKRAVIPSSTPLERPIPAWASFSTVVTSSSSGNSVCCHVVGGSTNATCSVIPTPTASTQRDNTPPANPTIAGTTPTLRDTALAAARIRMLAPSGAITPTTRVPRVFRHSNSPPPPLTDPLQQLSPFQAPPASLPLLGTTHTCAPAARVIQAPSAPISLSMVNTTSRLHKQHHTQPYRVPPRMFARTLPQESLTPPTRPTLFTTFSSGLNPNADQVAALTKMPMPENTKQTRSLVREALSTIEIDGKIYPLGYASLTPG